MQYGPLTSTKLIGNGVAFVRYDMPRNAQLAIQELNGRIVAGGSEPILVKLANSCVFFFTLVLSYLYRYRVANRLLSRQDVKACDGLSEVT